MKKKHLSRFSLILFAALFFMPMALLSMPGFNLEDQFGMKHTAASLSGKVVVIIASDQRKATDFIRDWSKAIINAVKDPVNLRGFCNLDGLPFFIPNSSIKNSIKKNIPASVKVYCDWEGDSYKKFGFGKNGVTVAIYDKSGKRVKTVTGVYNQAGLQQVLAALKELGIK